ncbi:MAG TPA: GyrI-like domain-containing protein [Verrucomicrobiae bacterium]|jgi:AraC family transcriptional regulator
MTPFVSLAQMSGTRPKHTSTWNDYHERILRVLIHIQKHLDGTLDLEELSRIACFSSFHFHRIFAAMTGETLADHVRRLRLERAATELTSDAKQVIQVALDAGYEAHEAFTRAFKTAYGVAPAQFRRTPRTIAIRPASSGVHFRPGIPLTRFNTNHIRTKVMKVITKKIKPMHVAYLRHVGPYEETRQTWMYLIACVSTARQIRKRSVFIGMGHDNPAVTPAAELRYDACITVDKSYKPRKPIELKTIAGGDHAVIKNCPAAKIKNAFGHLYGRWLAQSGRELRPTPGFMVLTGVQTTGPRKPRKQRLRVDIYMPLQLKRHLNKSEQMKIELTTLKPQRVAYMRRVGPYDGASEVWTDLMARLKKDGLPRKNSQFIGVPLDNPKTTPREKLRYDACVTVDAKYTPKKPVRVQTLADGDYAVVRNCPIGAIAKGYEKLFVEWLPKSGRKWRKAPSFLVAVNGAEGARPAFGITDIYVPLEGKAEARMKNAEK